LEYLRARDEKSSLGALMGINAVDAATAAGEGRKM
jgi:hypothetical protein